MNFVNRGIGRRNMEDGIIVSLLWQRAEHALEELARRFGKRLYQTANNILSSSQDAEEAVNDTYLAVWNSVPPQKPDPLPPFVYRIGRNIALDRLKRNTAVKRDGRYDLSIDELAACIPASALEEQVEARELGAAINTFLKALSPDNRTIFLRRYWFGDSVLSIARDLEMRQNTVTVRLSRLRMQLRTYLMGEGYMDE